MSQTVEIELLEKHRSCGFGYPIPLPLLINRARFLGIYMDVAIGVGVFSFADTHGLVPAMHSRNRIGMDWEGQILMHADVAPPDAQGIRVGRFVWSRSAFAF